LLFRDLQGNPPATAGFFWIEIGDLKVAFADANVTVRTKPG